MACGSCGGARTYTVTAASGQQESVYVSKTKYVWRWISSDGVATETFDSEQEARAHLAAGKHGTLTIVPVQS
jgi:hypothetical protein